MARYKNQRQSLRHWVAVPVLIRNDGLRIEGLSINISEGGIYVFAAATFAIGTRIEIEFRLSHSKRSVRTGIEFLKEDIAPVRDHSIAQINSEAASSPTS